MKCTNCNMNWYTQIRCCPTCGQLCTDTTMKKSNGAYLILSIILTIVVFLLCVAIGFDESQAMLVILISSSVIWLWYACGYCVQSLAWRKGYNISYGWGYWFGIFAILYWGFVPVEPTLQASIIEKAIRQAQQPVNAQEPTQPMPVEVQKPTQTTPVEAQLCTSCGAKLKPGASFCSQCGSAVKQ